MVKYDFDIYFETIMPGYGTYCMMLLLCDHPSIY